MTEDNFNHIDPQQIDIPILHQILLGSIAPRPIAFVSTTDPAGNINLSPFSFFNVFGINPPTLIFSPSRRGRDKTEKHTYLNLKEIPEAVVNIVTYEMVHQVAVSSFEYERGVNEFHKSGFTPVDSIKVKPPRVAESPVSFECSVQQIIETGTAGGAGNLIISKILLLHVRKDVLKDGIKIDPSKMNLIGRMGENFYCKAFGESIFAIPKAQGIGMGYDNLPIHIKNSNVLSGNNLGQLASLPHMPSPQEIEEVSLYPEVKLILEKKDRKWRKQLHQLARQFLDKNEYAIAFSILMTGD